MSNLLTHADFLKQSECSHRSGFEELNEMKADLSEKDTVNMTSVFKSVMHMVLKGGEKYSFFFDEDEQIQDVSEIEDIVNDAVDDLFNKDLDKAIEKDKQWLCKGLRRAARYEISRGRRDSDDWEIIFNKSLAATKEFHPTLEEVIPQVKGKDGIQCFFDTIFINHKDKIIEGVKYKGGQAWLSAAATGKVKIEDDPWSNINLKALETLVPEDETYTVQFSYYHLKPKGVRPEQGNWEFIDFDKNSSIVSLAEEFCNNDEFKIVPTAQDDIVKDVFKDLAEGEIECSEEDCKSCFMKPSCHFQKTPEDMEEKEVKKGKKPDPSEAQQKVIDWREGALCVIAGAGAGKTECSSEHMFRTILDEADKLCAINSSISREEAVKAVLPKFFMTTFTNAGVIEMKERMIGKLLNEDIVVTMDDLNIMTFNTFAYTIDRKYYEELGYTKEPLVCDVQDIRNKKIIIEMLNEHKVSGLNYESPLMDTKNCRGALPCAIKVFSAIKTEQLDLDDPDFMVKLNDAVGYSYTKFMEGSALDELVDIYKEYEQELLDQNLITFADQEPMAMKMLEAHPEYLEELGYEHIVVDEFQDSNDIQMDFVNALCSTSSYKSLVVVGDDFQAIYGFRHTSPENMIHFPEKFCKDCEVHYLVDNYRSVPEVIDVSNKFIKNNENQLPKDIVAFRESQGKDVKVRGFYDKDEEDEWIVKTVQAKLDEGRLPEDICIITGTNDEITRISAKLLEANIPVVLKNPQKYIENSRVQAAIKLANAIWEPQTTENYFPYLVCKYNGELVKEYDSSEILEMLEEMKEKFTGFSNFEYGYQRKLFHDLLDEIKSNDEIFQGFLDLLMEQEDFPTELDYIQDFKKYGRDAATRMNQLYQGVVLVTAHSSKGLEWPVVINTLDGYDTVALHTNGSFWKSQIEEKRRLVYVSMTRARDELYVIGKYEIAGATKSGDVVIPAVRNRFLKEVFDILDPDGYIPVDPNADYKKQMKKEKAKAAKEERARRKALREKQRLLAKYKGNYEKAKAEALKNAKPKAKRKTKTK